MILFFICKRLATRNCPCERSIMAARDASRQPSVRRSKISRTDNTSIRPREEKRLAKCITGLESCDKRSTVCLIVTSAVYSLQRRSIVEFNLAQQSEGVRHEREILRPFEPVSHVCVIVAGYKRYQIMNIRVVKLSTVNSIA